MDFPERNRCHLVFDARLQNQRCSEKKEHPSSWFRGNGVNHLRNNRDILFVPLLNAVWVMVSTELMHPLCDCYHPNRIDQQRGFSIPSIGECKTIIKNKQIEWNNSKYKRKLVQYLIIDSVGSVAIRLELHDGRLTFLAMEFQRPLICPERGELVSRLVGIFYPFAQATLSWRCWIAVTIISYSGKDLDFLQNVQNNKKTSKQFKIHFGLTDFSIGVLNS